MTEEMTTAKRGKKRGDRANPLRKRLRKQREEAYRQAIAEAAERVFAAKGSDRSRMREIAAEAGISLGTLYAVIEGKQSLFAGIHETRVREFLDCIRSARDAHEDTLESHLAVLRSGAEYFLARPDFLRMCCRDGFGWAPTFSPSARGSGLWNEGMSIPRELFARGIAEGIYVDEDPDLLVRKMLAFKQAELTHWVAQKMDTDPELMLERLEDQFIRAFCKPGRQERSKSRPRRGRDLVPSVSTSS
jgi:AcrR family transcriptional regulator